MKAAVFAGTMDHHRAHAGPMADGLKRHGIEVEFYQDRPPLADFVVTWGWGRAKAVRQPVLVMERGYLGDRLKVWTSLGWNGLNGRARWNKPGDDGERFRLHFGHLIGDWTERDGYALLIGQVEGDQSIAHVNIHAWYMQAGEALKMRGFDVKFRPHPNGNPGRPIEEDFAGTGCVVTFNSNAGVLAALAGIPVIACDIGSMAWPIAAHGLEVDLIRPDRCEWLSGLAWKQWTREEIACGLAWDHVGCARP